MKRVWLTVALLALLATLSGCGPEARTQSTATATTRPRPTVTAPAASATVSPTATATAVLPTPTSGRDAVKEETPTTSQPSAQPLVEQARSDLARRLGVPGERIEVVEVRSVVWPDGSLGCPQPGMRYIQVLTDGALILLRYEGRIYEYHSGGSRPPFLCEQTPPGAKPIVPKLDPFATPPRSGNQ